MSHLRTKKGINIWLLIFYRLTRYSDIRKVHLDFLKKKFGVPVSLKQKLGLIKTVHELPYKVECASTENENIEFISEILAFDKNTDAKIAEVGVYKGGSSCKYSIAAKLAGKKFVLFDSFEGIPDNNEVNEYNIHGAENVYFPQGSYFGALEEVKSNIQRHGDIQVCEFVKGYVEDSLPSVKDKFCAVYLDLDLASATATAIKYFYPLLIEGGVIYSQDGHLPLVIDLLKNEDFWKNEVGIPVPHIEGLGKKKLVRILKKDSTLTKQN